MRRCWSVTILFLLVASACTDEQTTPIDLDEPAPVTSEAVEADAAEPGEAPPLPEDDPNADARNQVIELAKDECRKDPTREVGVVVIADTEGNEVNRFEFPCADLDDGGDDDGNDDDDGGAPGAGGDDVDPGADSSTGDE